MRNKTPIREDITAAAQADKVLKLFAGELKKLPEQLFTDETVTALAITETKDTKKQGVLVLTNKRVIFYRDSFLNGHEFRSIALNKISEINFVKTGLLLGSVIQLRGSGIDLELKAIDPDRVRTFVTKVQEVIL